MKNKVKKELECLLNNDLDQLDNNGEKFNVEQLTKFQLARWAALVEAVNIIAEKAKDRKLQFKRIAIKPSAIQHYVDSASDIICNQMDMSR